MACFVSCGAANGHNLGVRRVGRDRPLLFRAIGELALVRPLGVVRGESRGMRRAIPSRVEKRHIRGLHRLASEHVLDVRDGASAVGHDGSTRQDGHTLLGGVQHLLDAGENTRNIWRDERVLHIVCDQWIVQDYNDNYLHWCSRSTRRAAATTKTT